MLNILKRFTKNKNKINNHDILTEANAIANDQELLVYCDLCNGMTQVKFTEKRTRINYVDGKEGRSEVYICKTHIPFIESGNAVGGDF